jgi:hypothetical protein
MDFKDCIKAHLDKMAQQDFAFAERYNDKKKSLDKCVKYIMAEAKKQAKNGCAAIEDAVVFGWAAHYYQEDNVEVDESVKAKVKAPSQLNEKDWEKTTMFGAKTKVPKEIKPVKALVKDKKNESKCIQMDLFEGFF